MKSLRIGAVFLVLTPAVVFAAATIAQTIGAAADPAGRTAEFPVWAYPWDPKVKPRASDDVPRRVPGSTATFTFAQTNDLFFSPDWHPDNARPVPAVVARGRKPDVRACGSCHRAEGTGGPENSSLAGLPAAYIVQQMVDYKSGARRFSGPERGPTMLMIAAAKAATDAEVHAAASYFSSLKLQPIIKVIETDTVPKTRIARNFFVISEPDHKEPIGQRIVEMPIDVEQFELRDSRSQFVAYVPVGSIDKGEALAKTGGAGKTVACATCHGPDLKGLGPIPGLAGRSPSYTVRQLYDFQQGTRAGIASALMKPTVERLSQDDMISLAAYVASLAP
jgi:cytochrome c553